MLHIADNKQGDLAASKEKEEQQLQAEMDTTKPSPQAKDQTILNLKEELQEKQKAMTLLTEQFEQKQKELEMLQQNGIYNLCEITNSLIIIEMLILISSNYISRLHCLYKYNCMFAPKKDTNPHISCYTVANRMQSDLATCKDKEQQLVAELNTIRRVYRAMSQEVSSLKQEGKQLRVDL